MVKIQGFHAHVYYDETTYVQAKQLCDVAGSQLPVSVGHMHTQAVGPHPCWSCQLSFGMSDFSQVASWLCLNRENLTIFLHPVTNDHLKDHSNHAIWMGKMVPLKLSIFS